MREWIAAMELDVAITQTMKLDVVGITMVTASHASFHNNYQ